MIILNSQNISSSLSSITATLTEKAEEEAYRIREVGPTFGRISPNLKCIYTYECDDDSFQIFASDNINDNAQGEFTADNWRDEDLISPSNWDWNAASIWAKANTSENLVNSSDVGRQIYVWVAIAVVLTVVLLGLIGAFTKFAPPPRIAGLCAFIAILFLWVLMAVHIALATGTSDVCEGSNEFIRRMKCADNVPGTECTSTDLTMDNIAYGIRAALPAAGFLECNEYTNTDQFLDMLNAALNGNSLGTAWAPYSNVSVTSTICSCEFQDLMQSMAPLIPRHLLVHLVHVAG